MRLILFATIFTLSVSVTACASTGWQSFSFDGHTFVGGSGNGAVLLRDGYLPVPAGAPVHREDQLPKKTGAIAIFCYQEGSGGKLKRQPAAVPMEGMTVMVARSSFTVAGRSDASGFFILALPPGSYQVTVLGFTKSVVVESDKTALASFRGGKRMVD